VYGQVKKITNRKNRIRQKRNRAVVLTTNRRIPTISLIGRVMMCMRDFIGGWRPDRCTAAREPDPG
jgi:hypothetical protein